MRTTKLEIIDKELNKPVEMTFTIESPDDYDVIQFISDLIEASGFNVEIERVI